ncbi:TetR/AcrR family transcriptional regulator [Nocardia miyunensis]|uniref:TetR/AcrR family transcriptional regulator n=1 Tax=Nocardia miyunensis TaxID=282684 RepID=UPI000A006569|nr:TetR family transcriptional regulator [Nocardia miyunensis]
MTSQGEQRSTAQRRTYDPERNRQAVLAAARRLFAAQGYDAVSIRAIATEAGVTAGLVMSYFGSKDALFREVVGGGAGIGADVVAQAHGGPERLAQALAHAYLERWDQLPADDPWPALIRSALTHPPSAAMLREVLEKQVSGPLTRLLDGSATADASAGLVRSILFGVIMERYLFAHEPARSVPAEELEPALAAVLAVALQDMPTPADVAEEAEDTGADTVVRILAEWQAELPGTDVSALAVFGRLHRCFLRYQTQISRIVERHGISFAALDVLTALRRAGAPYRRTAGDLATSSLVSTGGITLRADKLEEAGLILRERDENDRRIVYLRLTDAGLALTDRLIEDHFANELDMLAGLVPAERRRLAALLERLERSLEVSGQRERKEQDRVL